MKLQKMLESLVNRTCTYKNETFIVESVKQYGKTIEIKTDKRTLLVPMAEEREFLENFVVKAGTETDPEKDSLLPAKIENTTKIQSAYKGTALELKAVLLNSIDKLDESPDFLKQAAAINQTVNTLLNVFKLELQIQKLANNKL